MIAKLNEFYKEYFCPVLLNKHYYRLYEGEVGVFRKYVVSNIHIEV
jgi:hypothetical protein